MTVLEEHHTADRACCLMVLREVDGDTLIGFDGHQWHTHGDMLSFASGLPEEKAIRTFVDSILTDGAVIAISRIAGEVRDVWITEHPKGEFEYKPPEESLEFRRWSGAVVNV